MARVITYLLEPEMNALYQLAQQDYGSVKARAALIIRNEPKRLGMVEEQTAGNERELNGSSESISGGQA